MDKNYWKDAYQHLWSKSSSKEKFVKKMIEDSTGFEVREIGLGAGSEDFIEGNAEDNKYVKGDADLYVVESESFVEVTGPNIKMSIDAPLWFRPDKLRNSFKKISDGKGNFHYAFHLQEVKGSDNKMIRILVIDQLLKRRLDDKQLNTIYPFIRGRQETYIEIPANDPALISFEEFIERQKNKQ